MNVTERQVTWNSWYVPKPHNIARVSSITLNSPLQESSTSVLVENGTVDSAASCSSQEELLNLKINLNQTSRIKLSGFRSSDSLAMAPLKGIPQGHPNTIKGIGF